MKATTSSVDSLRGLACAYGVQTSYTDLSRRRRHASPEALVAVLNALGAPVGSPSDATAVLRNVQNAADRDLTPPIVVGRPGRVLNVPLSGVRTGSSKYRVRIAFEDGATITHDLAPERNRLRVPGPWPMGYHELQISRARESASVRALVAPQRCYRGREDAAERRWGVFLPLYALRTRHDWGSGDFTGLGALQTWATERGATIVGTLPLLPQFLDDPCDPSPYSPVSRMFWNEFFVDPTATAEWPTSRQARSIAQRNRQAIARYRRTAFVDYRGVMQVKRETLTALSAACYEQERRRNELEFYLRSHPAVVDYAQFRAACERHGVPWSRWPARLREGRLRNGDYDEGSFRYHVYAQWSAEQQLSAAARRSGGGGGLYLDLPLGVNPAGYDTWRERGVFLSGLSAGAPPDPFFTKGQKWGLPPLNPNGLRRDGYRHLIACLRHHMRHAGLLRIDHIMGLHRLFCVPQEMDATEGVYVTYPAEEFYAVLKIESHRAECAVAGEDLGTVPERVRTSMSRHGVDRLYVMQFSFDGRRVATPPERSVASLNTHDTAPFAGFYRGEDIDYRVGLGLMTREEAKAESRGRAGMRASLTAFLRKERLLPPGKSTASAGAALRALLRFLARSPAATMLVNLEDLWLETEQQNTPGTTSERANWKRRASRSFNQFTTDQGALKILREIDAMRRKQKMT